MCFRLRCPIVQKCGWKLQVLTNRRYVKTKRPPGPLSTERDLIVIVPFVLAFSVSCARTMRAGCGPEVGGGGAGSFNTWCQFTAPPPPALQGASAGQPEIINHIL